ncbi:unnamed protein product [Paramecium octaurelia]|uniref:Uncharacterized protein n=1 Tax=Paramecium octaurelia TaxID=43137 RepID=A0A8S1Y6C4_PAROT|nr:unnamed protein product [Paramecium octaurelia]
MERENIFVQNELICNSKFYLLSNRFGSRKQEYDGVDFRTRSSWLQHVYVHHESARKQNGSKT